MTLWLALVALRGASPRSGRSRRCAVAGRTTSTTPMTVQTNSRKYSFIPDRIVGFLHFLQPLPINWRPGQGHLFISQKETNQRHSVYLRDDQGVRPVQLQIGVSGSNLLTEKSGSHQKSRS